MKDPKTTILGILTLLGTLIAAAIAVLKGGWGAIDLQGTVTAIIGVLTGLGLIKAADSKP